MKLEGRTQTEAMGLRNSSSVKNLFQGSTTQCKPKEGSGDSTGHLHGPGDPRAETGWAE